MEKIETSSDHCYISYSILSTRPAGFNVKSGCNSFPKWNIKKLDVDKFHAALMARTWCTIHVEDMTVDELTKEVRSIFTEVCDFAAPRSRGSPKRKRIYWWNTHLTSLRKKCVHLRKIWVKIGEPGCSHRKRRSETSISRCKTLTAQIN